MPLILLVVLAQVPAPSLPWNREVALKEAARTATVSQPLDAKSPAAGVTLSNYQVRSALWGPADRITLSLIKNDVFDRRYGTAPTVTLAQVRAGAMSPVNRGFDDMPPDRRRPVRGYLLPEGGRVDPYACWNAYPFPCQKPVGQIIVGLDELAGAEAGDTAQSCADGSVRIHLARGSASADLEIIQSMTRNVIGIQGDLRGIARPWLRLYRHVDQAYRRYMTADGKSFLGSSPGAASGSGLAAAVPFDYQKDSAWNGPVDAPRSGSSGRYFWIRQRLPAEKTFPHGFEYVLMGRAATELPVQLETTDRTFGLGTRPTSGDGRDDRLEAGYAAIRSAPGSAATARSSGAARITYYVTVVTVNDRTDFMAAAKRQLDDAAARGFAALRAENAAWYAALYDQRENGRIFLGAGSPAASESVAEVFKSWYCGHGGETKPDMRHYEASAAYANVEQDWQLWHSLPCYNELFYTPAYVRNRADSVDLWWKLVEAWRPASEANAREVYGARGMALVHGYLPPVKPDRYVHTNLAMEYCIDTDAQMVKPLWDQWDYSGDRTFLRDHAYPALRDVANFYASYATEGTDHAYHFSPALEAEAWGIFPSFARGQDSISSLSMARWAFRRAAEAAGVLGVDPGDRDRWLALADRLAPYPTYPGKDGVIFNSVPGTIPSWKRGDHPWFIGFYPTTLADEINLDSSPALKAEMVRTVAAVPNPRGREALALLGVTKAGSVSPDYVQFPERLLNSRSGRLHLFPGVRAGEIVAFRRFQARGGFLVSAVREPDQVGFVEIESRRDVPCQLMNPWPGHKAQVVDEASGQTVPVTADFSNGDCLIFPACTGARYQISRL